MQNKLKKWQLLSVKLHSDFQARHHHHFYFIVLLTALFLIIVYLFSNSLPTSPLAYIAAPTPTPISTHHSPLTIHQIAPTPIIIFSLPSNEASLSALFALKPEYLATSWPASESVYLVKPQLKTPSLASPAAKLLLPYLTDRQFCTQASDCVMRHSLCDYGPFNHFEPILQVFACLKAPPSTASACRLPPVCQASHCQINPDCQ